MPSAIGCHTCICICAVAEDACLEARGRRILPHVQVAGLGARDGGAACDHDAAQRRAARRLHHIDFKIVTGSWLIGVCRSILAQMRLDAARRWGADKGMQCVEMHALRPAATAGPGARLQARQLTCAVGGWVPARMSNSDRRPSAAAASTIASPGSSARPPMKSRDASACTHTNQLSRNSCRRPGRLPCQPQCTFRKPIIITDIESDVLMYIR